MRVMPREPRDRALPSQPGAAPRNNTVSAVPVSMATQRNARAPVMTTTGGITTIRHRAFLKPVANALTYEVERLPCNPGLGGSFPWLSKMARRYEEYRFTHLRYEFRSVAATSTPGVIMMSFDYDAADDLPSSKAVQAQTVPSTETNAWMNNDLTVGFDKTWKYVRSGTLAANLDIKTYDAGNLMVSAVYGNDITAGELYVDYTVELRRPTDGPEVSGQLKSVTTSTTTLFTPTGITIGGKAFPFAYEGPMKLRVVSGGEYLIGVLFGMNASVDYTPVVVTPTEGFAEILVQSRTDTKLLMLIRLRAQTGAIITFPAPVGTGLTDMRIHVGSADYDTMRLP